MRLTHLAEIPPESRAFRENFRKTGKKQSIPAPLAEVPARISKNTHKKGRPRGRLGLGPRAPLVVLAQRKKPKPFSLGSGLPLRPLARKRLAALPQRMLRKIIESRVQSYL